MSKDTPASGQLDPVQTWLQRQGFTGHPFGEWEASREESLQSYFNSPPFFDKMFGDPQNPATTFLFAGRGCGKTAHRIMFQTRARPENPHSTVLAVPYIDFAPFIGASLSESLRPTLEDHLRLILQNTLTTLLDELILRPNAWLELLEDEQNELRKLIFAYTPDLAKPSRVARRLTAQLDDKPNLREVERALAQGDLVACAKKYPQISKPAITFWSSFLTNLPSVAERTDYFAGFRRTVELACALGFDAIYVLVDNLDESLARLEPQAVADFLYPLVTTRPLMEMEHAAFKFFLPTTIGATIKRIDLLRLDRTRAYDLNWNDESLKELLKNRLQSFHKHGTDSLKAFAEQSAADIDEKLIRRARGSPRALIILGALLIDAHCANVPNPKPALTLADVDKAIERFNAEFSDATTSVPLLRIDEKARKVFRGGRLVDKEFSKREIDVLVYLYKARGMVRSRQEIAEAIKYVSNIDFDSMMSRLRDKVEPDPDNPPIYLRTKRGIGYHLEFTE